MVGIFHGELLVITRGYGFSYIFSYISHMVIFQSPTMVESPRLGSLNPPISTRKIVGAMKLFVKPIPGFITEGRGLRFSVDM